MTESEWFKRARATPSGTQSGSVSVHASPLVGGENVQVYSCTVRERGVVHGNPLGVLGILSR